MTSLNSLDRASITVTHISGLNAEPGCIPPFTSNLLLLPWTVGSTVFAHVIDQTTSSLTPRLHTAHLIKSWRHIKCFFLIHKILNSVQFNL